MRVRIERVDDLDGEPVIGRKYSVPCVKCEEVWWPVFGGLHNDKEYIGVEEEHWHYDWRFVQEWAWEDWTSTVAKEVGVMSRIIVKHELVSMKRKHMICLRQMPRFPIEFIGPVTQAVTQTPFAAKLEDAYADVRLKCLTCPHRGFSLKTLPVSPKGVVICPGHGLAWNLRTGEMVRRVTRERITERDQQHA